MFNSLFQKLSQKSRVKKVSDFFYLMNPSKNDTFLDVGGGTGLGFRKIWNYFDRVIVIDINEKAMQRVERQVKDVEPIIADACYLPFKDKSIDYVFSNAVIEHIVTDKRDKFAEEIERVAKKGYFITTPNYYFPYELHYRIPLYQYFPRKTRKIWLLSSKELNKLFPRAKIRKVRVTVWPETLISYRNIE